MRRQRQRGGGEVEGDGGRGSINRPKLFLDASLPQKKGKSYFNSHHTPLYEDDFSHDFLCACVKERVEIKNKTNKDQTKSTCPEGAHTRRTMAVQQMTPPKCKIFHNVMAALKCYTFWRSSVNHLRGLSQLSNRDGLFFLSSHNWQGTRFRIDQFPYGFPHCKMSTIFYCSVFLKKVLYYFSQNWLPVAKSWFCMLVKLRCNLLTSCLKYYHEILHSR